MGCPSFVPYIRDWIFAARCPKRAARCQIRWQKMFVHEYAEEFTAGNESKG